MSKSFETQTVLVEPSELTVRCGQLLITTADVRGGEIVLPHEINVMMDGKPVACKRLAFTFEIDSVPTIEMTFCPEQP